jgi:alkylated DNA repair dioxygenase AlkB
MLNTMDKQTNLFGEEPETSNSIIQLKDANLVYMPSFFAQQESDSIFSSLLNDITWKQDKINMYGKELPLPRLSAWYGDDSKSYTYSGIKLSPLPWSEKLLHIKKLVEEEANVNFSSVLLNRYRDGQDYVGWHTDAERELGQNPIIASVNFGSTRKFQLRRIDDHKEKFELELKHGTLLIMTGKTQHYWQHQVPKTKTKIGERINLTFRVIH